MTNSDREKTTDILRALSQLEAENALTQAAKIAMRASAYARSDEAKATALRIAGEIQLLFSAQLEKRGYSKNGTVTGYRSGLVDNRGKPETTK